MTREPMRSPKRNLYVLVALVVIWGLVFAFRSPRATEPRREVRAGVERPPRAPAAQGGGLPRLKTGLLDLPRPAYPPEVQNIFGTPPPPPRPPQAAVQAPAPPPPDPFQEEGKRLRYVGFLDAGKAKLAFIVQGQEVHTVEVGATFAARFRVQAITEDAVLLSSPDGEKQIRLLLAPDAGSRPSAGPGAFGRLEGFRL
jgi:hypothetical protein